jgi:hypothetical protein
MSVDSLLPDETTLLHWIELIHAQGVRRSGYPADRWAEQFLCDELRGFGIENVRLEPVELPYWEPRRAVLVAESGTECFEIEGSVPIHRSLVARCAHSAFSAKNSARNIASRGSATLASM